MASDSESKPLHQTLGSYGDVHRALRVFEGQCTLLLQSCHGAIRRILASGRLEVSGTVTKSHTWENYWAHWVYAEQPVKSLGRLSGSQKARLRLFLGWRKTPDSDNQVGAFAYLEIDYSKVSDRSGWKRFMGMVRDRMPPGISVERYKDYFAIMRDPEESSTYRDREEDLAKDFQLLSAALAKALRFAHRKSSKAGRTRRSS